VRRFIGAMNAMELVTDRETRAPDKARAAKVECPQGVASCFVDCASTGT